MSSTRGTKRKWVQNEENSSSKKQTRNDFNNRTPKKPLHGVETKSVTNIHFSMMSPQQILNSSVLEIVNDNIGKGVSNEGGLFDLRMGTLEKSLLCQTCGDDSSECPGHFGHIQLALPVFHNGHSMELVKILKCICSRCGKLLIEKKSKRYKDLMKMPEFESRYRANLKKSTSKKREIQTCVNGCGSDLPEIKLIENFNFIFKYPRIQPFLNKSDSFNPSAEYMLELLRRIPEEDFEFFDLHPIYARPESMILSVFPIPPPLLRPTNRTNNAAKGEDESTKKLSEIIKRNKLLKKAIEQEKLSIPPKNDRENSKLEIVEGSIGNNNVGRKKKVTFRDEEVDDEITIPIVNHNESVSKYLIILQRNIALYIDSDKPGPKTRKDLQKTGKPIKGICQLLKGKYGLYRAYISGKRLNYSARTVITPDPNLKLNQVGIPRSMSKILTFPETVTSFNIERLTRAVKRGPNQLNGANHIFLQSGEKVELKYVNYDRFVEKHGGLQLGMTVHRHLVDGDITTANRQPSLHKHSIQAVKIKVLPYSTVRLPLSVTTPYNADFDGDEMNINAIQDVDSKVEILELMSPEANLLSAQNNGMTMGLVQDALLGIHLMSTKDIFFDKIEFQQLVAFTENFGHREMPVPAIVKSPNGPLWTGKQLIQYLLPKINYKGTCTNFKSESESVSTDQIVEALKTSLGRTPTTFEINSKEKELKRVRRLENPTDGRVLIKNGDFIYGTLCKKSMGKAKDSILRIITLDHSPFETRRFMDDCGLVANEFLMHHSVSIGIMDMEVPKDIEKTIDSLSKIAKDHIEQIENNEEYSEKMKEARSNKIMNDMRNQLSKGSVNNLSSWNGFKKILNAGSKGSEINPTQMVILVGQQNVEGKRPALDYDDRTMTWFPNNCKTPESRGAIFSSYYKGLNASEYWFQSQAARTGLIDTTCKTCETGYLNRKLMKAMEDITAKIDGTVRNSKGNVISFIYGEDGMDASRQEWQTIPYERWSEETFQRKVIYSFPGSEGNQYLKDEIESLREDMVFSKKNIVSFRVTMPIDIHRIIKNVVDSKSKDPTSFSITIPELFRKRMELFKELDALLPLHANRNGPLRILLSYALRSKNIIGKNQFTTEMWNDLQKNIITTIRKCLVHPGEAVGVVAGQGISEPATQMTLNTFHFAGISEKNVTLGVPRFKEILNDSKQISTPSMTLYLKDDFKRDRSINLSVAKSLEDVSLKDVVIESKIWKEEVDQNFLDCFRKSDEKNWSIWKIHFQMDTIKLKSHDIKLQHIANIIENHFKENVSCQFISEFYNPCFMTCRFISEDFQERTEYFIAKEIHETILSFRNISGIPNITKCFVVEDVENRCFKIETEGSNLREMLFHEKIDPYSILSNDAKEINSLLGIEASRMSIFNGTKEVLSFDNGYVNSRHINLVADFMTWFGHHLKYTRYGINRNMENGTLVKASFEETPEILHRAARNHETDHLRGVTEAITMGKLCPIGTGTVKICMKPD